MPEKMEVDLAVIGAGPAGQKGAIQGAKAGKRVVVIDRLGRLGGACLRGVTSRRRHRAMQTRRASRTYSRHRA